jgi:hypothetical protein
VASDESAEWIIEVVHMLAIQILSLCCLLSGVITLTDFLFGVDVYTASAIIKARVGLFCFSLGLGGLVYAICSQVAAQL